MSQTTSAPASFAPALPRLTTTVPREYVHRAAVAEVLLTGWRKVEANRFRVWAQWPRGHSFFSPLRGVQHDPMLVAETVRQIGSLLAHAEFDVPLGFQFLMWHLDYSLRPRHTALESTPAELVLDVECSEIRRKGRSFGGMRYDVVIRRDGAVAATGSASYTCTSPEVYRRLRGDRIPGTPPVLGAPVRPRRVGRRSPFDVVLAEEDSPGAARWRLRADGRHPVLFDHPVDHVPGMVLLEAARQAAAVLSPDPVILPTELTSSFHRYAELDSPIWIEATRETAAGGRNGPATTVVRGHQDDELLFTCALTSIRPRNAATPPGDTAVNPSE
ncbi:ScbA/BarX family gamma-butyrolactone biosynthesis protein [Streptomyces abikoensis]|uniref:ScbA/BarX family gamma-butyrolactone biosynthesis protein n=1 Tax=Streptomyces abikoensis TaxID=97398 RepID=UPI0033DEFEFB